MDRFLETMFGDRVSPTLGRNGVTLIPDDDVPLRYPDDDSGLSSVEIAERPAQPETDDILSILREIRDNTRRPNDQGNTWEPKLIDLPNTTSGSISVHAVLPFKYVFVSNAPRAIKVYAGIGQSLFLGDLTSGDSLWAELPFPVNGITISWSVAGSAGEQITAVLSSEKFEVKVY